jgi:hypoxanthine phosphoribosyltransferase
MNQSELGPDLGSEMGVNPGVDPLAVLHSADLLYDRPTVEAAIDRIAVQLTLDFAERLPVVISVLTGGIMFTGDLMQRLQFPLTLDYLHATRYRGETEGREVHWLAQPVNPVQGRNVLLIDDVLDHGDTLAAARQALLQQGAVAVYTVVLVDKQRSAAKPLQADYVALRAPDRYLFGRGMDYKGYWRNLDAIYAVANAP